jgi:hypothetical protein
VSGKKVRAGARNVDKARKELEGAVEEGFLTAQQAGKIQVVPFDLEDESSIEEALRGVTKVRGEGRRGGGGGGLACCSAGGEDPGCAV